MFRPNGSGPGNRNFDICILSAKEKRNLPVSSPTMITRQRFGAWLAEAVQWLLLGGAILYSLYLEIVERFKFCENLSQYRCCALGVSVKLHFSARVRTAGVDANTSKEKRGAGGTAAPSQFKSGPQECD
jgi:hypothetical protein